MTDEAGSELTESPEAPEGHNLMSFDAEMILSLLSQGRGEIHNFDGVYILKAFYIVPAETVQELLDAGYIAQQKAEAN